MRLMRLMGARIESAAVPLPVTSEAMTPPDTAVLRVSVEPMPTESCTSTAAAPASTSLTSRPAMARI